MMVNSLNPGHYRDILEVMKGTNIRIFQSESNGACGKGKNSVLALFQELTDYDYLIPIDGDDFLYPTAFHQMGKTLHLRPHCLAIQTNDSLTREIHEVRHATLENGWRLTSWFDDCENWWLTHKLHDPFREHIRVCRSPVRPVLYHRTALAHLPHTAFGEEFTLFDDMIYFARICEAWYRRPTEFNLLFTSNTYIYLHNDFNPASLSNSVIDFDRENALFAEATKDGFHNIKRWQLQELPHCHIPNPIGFGKPEKIAFAKAMTEALDRLE